MNDINNIFFELICVAIGTWESLSRIPSEVEWKALLDMATKQALAGICFAGLQHLGADADDGYERIGMTESQYLEWMSVAASIHQRNEDVNHQCIELQRRLAADGIKSSILKGQGCAQLYGDLASFRQSGDIDVWVNAPKDEVIAWAEKVGISGPAGYLHVGARCFEDTAVELHYKPTYMRSLRHNRRMQKFCDGFKDFHGFSEIQGMLVPSYEFNVIYLLSHIYRHLFGLGIGLRQLMDYYFVLRSKGTCSYDLHEMLSHLGLRKFAGAVMYVMREVFHLEKEYMICPVDERRGKALLDSVMQTGNFGKMDDEQKAARSTFAGNLKYKIKQWWRLVRYYPEETLSAPLWAIITSFER